MKYSDVCRALIADTKGTLKQLSQTQLEALIRRLDAAYFDNTPSVPDSVYDAVRKHYVQKYPDGKLVQKVGGRKAESTLPVPMASLNQLYQGTSALDAALQDGPWCITDKHDGQSIELVYTAKQGLTKVFTRGTATTGRDISYHIPYLNAPVVKADMVVRCEAQISDSAFAKYLHKDAGGQYVAARNAAGGMINNTVSSAAMRHLDLIALEILRGDGAGAPRSKQLQALRSLGFKIPVYKVMRKLTASQLPQILDDRIRASSYELDGIVCTLDKPYAHSGSQNPDHEFKFKINSEASMVNVVCTGVVYQKSKYGKLTPVATYEPTVLAGGATCTRATAFNGFFVENGYIKDKGGVKRPIGKGAVLKIVRSGSVIPYIVEVVKGARKPDLPKEFVRKGIDFYADKDSESRTRLITDFFKILGAKDFGPATVGALVEEGINLAAIVKYGSAVKQVCTDLVGPSKASIMEREIQKLKTDGAKLPALLQAVGQWYIKGMGVSKWELVLDYLPHSLSDLAAMSAAQVRSALAPCTQVKALARDLEQTPRIASQIIKLGIPVKKVRATSTVLANQVLLFTGFRDQELAQRCESAGAKMASGFSRNVTMVVAADIGATGGKLDKARAAGTKIISRTALEKML